MATNMSKNENEAATTAASKPGTWKVSIWVCILAVALSAAGAAHLLQDHPLFFAAWKARRPRSHDDGAFQHSLLWMAPFFSGGGYCSEAISYITAIQTLIPTLAIRHHGDAENLDFWKGLPLSTRQTLASLSSARFAIADSVVVCHSEPGAWHPPLYMTPPCPPQGSYRTSSPLYVIGRTMFETDGVTAHHVERCNKMDEVWVPTAFHLETFTRAGVLPQKLVKVVQPVDTKFFNPAHVQPLRLPTARPLLGEPGARSSFVFLSIFKWEHRKGWDVLLRSYLCEFSASDDVALYLLTNPYHSERDFATVISKFVLSGWMSEPASGWARIYILDEHVPEVQLPGLYRAADCFVLPSRGEGWGRPHVEAMAMELPVIATNWSGMTEYMTEENAYPLQVERMSEVLEGPFKGHLWAEPSRSHLRALMRHVVLHPEEARRKGQVARKDMVTKFSQQVVGRIVEQELLRIQAKIATKFQVIVEDYFLPSFRFVIFEEDAVGIPVRSLIVAS